MCKSQVVAPACNLLLLGWSHPMAGRVVYPDVMTCRVMTDPFVTTQ